MSEDGSVKIQVIAKELGVTQKTVYNWINTGTLVMTSPGYVDRDQAWEVYDSMKSKRVEISYFMSAYGITRDSYGRFTSEGSKS